MRDPEPLYEHLVWLARHGMTLTLGTVADHLNSSDPTIMSGLRKLHQAKRIVLEVRRHTAGPRRRFYRVTITATGRSTKWPIAAGFERVKTPVELQDELTERKILVEETRAAARRHWLEQERAPRRRPMDDDHFFIDRETARALSGGYA